MTKRVVFLMSDTGGGHRAAAEAIIAALEQRYGASNFDFDVVDVFRHCRWPLNRQPEWYAWMVKHARWLWGALYSAGDGGVRSKMAAKSIYQQNRRRLIAMAAQYPADVLVSVHSVITRPSMSAYRTLPDIPPLITVVTDLVSTPTFWYDPRATRCLVPTQTAYDRGLKFGLKPAQLRLTGMPIHPGFTGALIPQAEARENLDWHPTKPAILMMSGGDGMGPLYETAQAIDARKLDCQLAIVTGKNAKLKTKLEASDWQQPTHVYGFRRDIPQMMAAADMIVTKAGPATIMEAALAGLPMILSDRIPGQEKGNVTYVVDNEAGVYTPDPKDVAETVSAWLAEGHEGLKIRADRARQIARPEAVWSIADE
ncbi:MAG: MGDG synthase family glycosyltransferase, partial [Aggregatilineales bacterium]